MKNWLTFLLLLLTGLQQLAAQKVIYSEPDKEDTKQSRFDILGKVGSNILVYKNIRDNHDISVYDMEMKQTARVKLGFLPERIINADFINYNDFAYMFYQYQKRNVVYAMAARIDSNGKIIGEPITMDTTNISFWANNKLYNVINSDDKQRICLFKVNSRNELKYVVTTVLFDKEMQIEEKHQMQIDMPYRNDFLTEFGMDNQGNIVFARASRGYQNENINHLNLMTKKRGSNFITITELKLNGQYLDDIKIKVDNINRQYVLTSFFSKTRTGNIDGLYTCLWDAEAGQVKTATTHVFNEQLRGEARGQNSYRTAFNDYFLNNIVVRKDGGFLLVAESFYTTGRAGGFNRMDYLWGSPFLRPMDYYMFSPYSYSYPWWRWNSFNQATNYHAQNVAVFSFDSAARVSWTNIINKVQWDDQTDAFIGYQMVNTGDQLYFLFNQQEKRLQLLTSQSISPDGQINRNPTLRNLDKGYDFMPRYGKQVGSRLIVVPCIYRAYLCFALIEI